MTSHMGEKMKKREYKTKSRTLILQYLIEEKEHTVSITDIAAFLENQGENVNVSTIYRYLDKLVLEGKVMKYQNEEGKKAVFQYVEELDVCHQHLHMQCVKCGKVIHLNCGFMQEISEHMMEHHQFRLQCHNSILFGTCHQCEKK
ncbi:MAG: transcriptional repressor [Lachnospiraceae bacterium]|nr:transcriptional repressor [Lachnospiraceae bacterium]